jgi:hypothetical protein
MTRPSRDATTGRVRMHSRPSLEVRVYPNVIYIIEDGKDVLAVTPEQWGEMVEVVGISGLAEVPRAL